LVPQARATIAVSELSFAFFAGFAGRTFATQIAAPPNRRRKNTKHTEETNISQRGLGSGTGR
jgi:hypothetical protein